jgi:hypothetical protein
MIKFLHFIFRKYEDHHHGNFLLPVPVHVLHEFQLSLYFKPERHTRFFQINSVPTTTSEAGHSQSTQPPAGQRPVVVVFSLLG